MKAILAVVGVVVLAIVAYAFVKYRAIQEAGTGPAKEIVSESMEKTGDTWHVKFVSKFDAPLDKVFDAFQHPERIAEFAPENVMKAEMKEDKGDTKVVEVIGTLDILPPGFKVQDLVTEYTVYPADHRITSPTIDFKLADHDSQNRFTSTSDGKTLLTFTQSSKQKQQALVEALQKGAIRETYITQVRAVNRALGLAPMPEKRAAG